MNPERFNPKFILKEGVHGKGVFATARFHKGEELFTLSGPIVDKPTRTSIQIGKNKHVEDDIGIYINHNCFPNAKVNRKSQSLVSLRDIEIGEEITFDYNKNEDVIAAPFYCHCCNKQILGKNFSKVNV